MTDTGRATRVLSISITAVLIILVAFNIYLLIARALFHDPLPRILGYTGAVVLSGSMADTINANDLVIVHKQDTYHVDDVVTYVGAGSTPVTHRVMERTPDGYITQGDANNTPDAEVTEDQVVGRVVAVIPWIGFVRVILTSPLGISLILGAIVIYLFLRPRLKSDASKEN